MWSGSLSAWYLSTICTYASSICRVNNAVSNSVWPVGGQFGFEGAEAFQRAWPNRWPMRRSLWMCESVRAILWHWANWRPHGECRHQLWWLDDEQARSGVIFLMQPCSLRAAPVSLAGCRTWTSNPLIFNDFHNFANFELSLYINSLWNKSDSLLVPPVLLEPSSAVIFRMPKCVQTWTTTVSVTLTEV